MDLVVVLTSGSERGGYNRVPPNGSPNLPVITRGFFVSSFLVFVTSGQVGFVVVLRYVEH